ncbi:hypothetical protein N0B16_03745 [Chryseobacterium sp. GMJ5]|uniref:DUF4329 domain-containing protein n=1 Tax=Chryseobacterium gilvum TaxID=2976534 RepID=A0ABT2VU64_9FLAO|nr:hypothetical protein [Chryseobacterium gilvum]MCU7613541.1 hypothetical protein [Chryseobacterium gilvum]
MKKNLFSRLCLIVAVMLSLFSCRNDLLPENNNLQNPNASRFRMVKLKDIPNIEQFIHQQSGRADLQVPLSEVSLTGKDLTIGIIETSTIVETVNGNEGYYVFKVENLNSGDAVYNLEVKQVDGIPVTAEIIEYDPQDGTTVDFQHFTGSISSYGLDGKAISTVNYNDGLANCSPATGVPGGNNTSEGGGINPIDLPPPNGGWYNWGEGGSNNNTVPFSNVPGDCTDIILDSHGNTQGWYDHCNNNYYPNPNVHKTTTTGEIPNLSPDCSGEGAGVIIASTHDPCEKIKENFATAKFKEKVTAIDKPEVFAYDHEMGYAAGYPPAGVTGTQYPPMENTLGTHNVRLPDGNQYFGFIHSHTNREGATKIFSPADLATFLTSCVSNADQSGNIGDAYAMVITSEGNYILKYTGYSTNFGYTSTTLDNWMEWYLTQLKKIQNDDNTFNQSKLEKVFIRFLKEKVQINGIQLYKVDKVTGKANELSLDANNNVVPIPCN